MGKNLAPKIEKLIAELEATIAQTHTDEKMPIPDYYLRAKGQREVCERVIVKLKAMLKSN